MAGKERAVAVRPDDARDTPLGRHDALHWFAALVADLLLHRKDVNHGRCTHERIRGVCRHVVANGVADRSAGLVHLQLEQLLACKPSASGGAAGKAKQWDGGRRR